MVSSCTPVHVRCVISEVGGSAWPSAAALPLLGKVRNYVIAKTYRVWLQVGLSLW